MSTDKEETLWFKEAIIYQLHVRSFFDRNGDGIGDFGGLKEKLDYLEKLGITAIWLLPFYPSPLKDDGYDISNYYGIHPDYGDLTDFKRFLQSAHQRNIRVITELVINHTSDQHPWFQRARRARPDSVWRNFYVWSQDPTKYKEARIIFQDFESSNWAWDSVANAYYWHRFYSHQPDLNFKNPAVQKEIFRALEFWFEMGVDGLRLDAIPYLFEKEGSNCENLQETHEFIKKLRSHMENTYSNRVLIAEANQWPEDAAAYFGEGDECHMAFHFPVMPRLFMAIQMEDRFPIIDILEQTPVIPFNCQWAMFLRNHDELTLEMVSDEERDYMYRIYAKDPKARINLGIRRRLAPLLDNDRFKIELMNVLLFSLPGTPILYYGDEIGMGDNYYLGDRHGVRTPMQWSSDRNAGFSRANPQRLFLPIIIDPAYHYEVVNVENQEQNTSSLLWWIRRLLEVRKRYKAFGMGTLQFITSDNTKVFAFTRIYQEEIILVIVNLSRFAQAAELDMSQYMGYQPIELFHYNRFSKIKDNNYPITLGPYGYFWFSLKPSESSTQIMPPKEIPIFTITKDWETLFKDAHKASLEKLVLPSFIKNSRWFDRKSCTIRQVKIVMQLEMGGGKLCFVEVRYFEIEDVDTYLLLIAFASQPEADSLMLENPPSILAHVVIGDQKGVLYDGIYATEIRKTLLQFILKRKKIKSNGSELFAYSADYIKKNPGFFQSEQLISQVLKVEQSNTSFTYGNQFFLKLYRKLQDGINPDIEMEKFLTEKAHFTHVPAFVGAIEWKKQDHLLQSLYWKV
jgi:maltose alpha-D-glucosyltransferase/alpha-amylase